MPELRPAAKIYIVLIAALAILVLFLSLSNAQIPTGERGLLALGLLACMTVATLFPIHIAFRTKLTLDTVAIFATVLLFEPGVAIPVIGIGALIGYLLQLRKQPPASVVFNSSQTMLQAAAGGTILVLSGWSFGQIAFDTPMRVAGVAGAALAIYLTNSVAVAIMIGLQTRMRSSQVWRGMLALDELESLAQFALGLLAAIVADAFVWALPLLLLPAGAVYLALARHLQLRTQTFEALESLADVVDLRDPYTANHSRRVAEYAREIAIEMGLSPESVEMIERAARVHDVGKVVIDTHLLEKQSLDDADWANIKAHPDTGSDILRKFPQFGPATQFVRHHHERVDGSGYPDGLAGEAIPIGARIIAVADAFDAMASDRPYRLALPADLIIDELERLRGKQWDPMAVDALLSLLYNNRLQVPGMPEFSRESDVVRGLVPVTIQ
jgi:HD-GYP domain-containing protein (c-di-GMP phosphodiesterase class II)